MKLSHLLVSLMVFAASSVQSAANAQTLPSADTIARNYFEGNYVSVGISFLPGDICVAAIADRWFNGVQMISALQQAKVLPTLATQQFYQLASDVENSLRQNYCQGYTAGN